MARRNRDLRSSLPNFPGQGGLTIRFIHLKSPETRIDSAKFAVGIDPERGIGRKLDSDIAELSGNVLIATDIGNPHIAVSIIQAQ